MTAVKRCFHIIFLTVTVFIATFELESCSAFRSKMVPTQVLLRRRKDTSQSSQPLEKTSQNDEYKADSVVKKGESTSPIHLNKKELGHQVVSKAGACDSSGGQNDQRAPNFPPSMMTGDIPNVWWRAIPISDLRAHPNFIPLPTSKDVVVRSALDLRQFRQESWQWDALHVGRLTTSKAATCLGFYEPRTASFLRIPRSLQGHSKVLSAWQHLLRRPPTNWDHLMERRSQRVASGAADKGTPSSSASGDVDGDELLPHTDKHHMKHQANNLWRSSCSPSSRYAKDMSGGERWHAYNYLPNRDRHLNWVYATRRSMFSDVRTARASYARMAWGSAQESTAILTAVNVFTTNRTAAEKLASESGAVIDENFKPAAVLESGMYPFEALKYDDSHLQYLQAGEDSNLKQVHGSDKTTLISHDCSADANSSKIYSDVEKWIERRELPLIGASPDGVIRRADGGLEVLEVKCLSPFISNSFSSGGKSSGSDSGGEGIADPSAVSRLRISLAGFKSLKQPGIGVWHVPQIQLEMFCVGAHCRSAIVVHMALTSTRIYRIARDDEYIESMMELLRIFHVNFIAEAKSNRRKPPPINFFSPSYSSSYYKFLENTVKLAKTAELVIELPYHAVQRSPFNTDFFLSFD